MMLRSLAPGATQRASNPPEPAGAREVNLPSAVARRQPQHRRNLLLCPRAARLTTAALREALHASPVAGRNALLAAARARGKAATAYVRHLLEGHTLGTGRPLTSVGVRQGLPLVATLLGGGAGACDDLGGNACQPRLLGRRALLAWRQVPPTRRQAFVASEPGGAALVEALDLLASGAFGVRVAAYQTSLRYLLLALVHGGLPGLARAARALAYAGDLRLMVEAFEPEAEPSRGAGGATRTGPNGAPGDGCEPELFVLATILVAERAPPRQAARPERLRPGRADVADVADAAPGEAAPGLAVAAQAGRTRLPRRRMPPGAVRPVAAALTPPAANCPSSAVAAPTGPDSPRLARPPWPVSAERTEVVAATKATAQSGEAAADARSRSPGTHALVEAADVLLQLGSV